MYGLCAGSNIIGIQKCRNGLFRPMSYFMCNTENRHSEIRFIIVNIIINVWEYYEDFIVDLSMVSTVDYKNAV